MHEEKEIPNMEQAFNSGLLENSLKIMSGKFGGGFYISYRFNRMNGFGCLKLIFQYPDGNVFAIPVCKNVGKPIDTEDEKNGVGTALKEVGPDAPPYIRNSRKKIAPQISSMKYYVKSDAFIQYERPDFPIPIKEIWKRIAELWEKIPIENWCGKFSPAEVYQALLEVGESKAEPYKEEAVVLLTRSEIEKVAEEMGYDFLEIRNEFESRKLWKKDRNSLGYQYSKKINGKVERFYALKKINTEQQVTINEEYAIEYTEK